MKVNKIINIGFILALTVMFSGCSTIYTFNKPQLYSGTINDLAACGKRGFQGVPCTIFVIPFDLALDTIMVPYKLILITADTIIPDDKDTVEK